MIRTQLLILVAIFFFFQFTGGLGHPERAWPSAFCWNLTPNFSPDPRYVCEQDDGVMMWLWSFGEPLTQPGQQYQPSDTYQPAPQNQPNGPYQPDQPSQPDQQDQGGDQQNGQGQQGQQPDDYEPAVPPSQP